jgi:hypothetical protein
LLDTHVPPGTPISLTPEVLASLEQALHRPAGVASYEALRQWGRRTHRVAVTYKTLSTIVRTRFRAKLKVPRPSRTKNPAAIAEFQAACGEPLQRVIPPEHRRPVRVFSQDESRRGL